MITYDIEVTDIVTVYYWSSQVVTLLIPGGGPQLVDFFCESAEVFLIGVNFVSRISLYHMSDIVLLLYFSPMVHTF